MNESPKQEESPSRPEWARQLLLWLRKVVDVRVGVSFVLGVLVTVLAFAFAAGGDGATNDHDQSVRPEHAEEVQTWTCSMHPQVRQPEAGQCPICGMDLIPAGAQSEADADPGRITLSERAKVLARVRTVPVVRKSDAAATLRLLGRVEPDEENLRSVTAWTGGRIERLHVNVTGQKVYAGQVIATLYSPEVLSAHQDLLVAKKQVERLTDGSQVARRSAQAGLEAARQRLRLIGVPDDELARMESKQQPTRSVPIRTPFGGTVIERLVTEGAYVSTGTPLYRIADLGEVWVQLDAYESDLPHVSEGLDVTVRVEALPEELFEGSITFVQPTLDPVRRTARVRVEVDNQDGRLRPGMFAEASVESTKPEGDSPLVVPRSAPLFTGRRALVYVEVPGTERPTYQARTVRLGPRLDGFYPVVAGLAEGERVVARGAFALDADLQIRGGASMMSRADDTETDEWDRALTIAAVERAKLAPVVEHYLQLQAALADDDLKPAQRAATQVREAARETELDVSADAEVAWSSLRTAIETDAQRVAQAVDLERARAGFEGLSHAVRSLLETFGNPTSETLSLAFCPMAMGSEGASWVQSGHQIDNSYFGASMRTCGEIEQRVTPGGFLGGRADAEQQPRDPSKGHQH